MEVHMLPVFELPHGVHSSVSVQTLHASLQQEKRMQAARHLQISCVYVVSKLATPFTRAVMLLFLSSKCDLSLACIY